MRKDGATEGEHSEANERIRRRLGKKGPSNVPQPPPFPKEVAYLWGWFLEVVQGLPANGMCPSPVAWTDLAAWSGLTGTELCPWEARALVALGDLRARVLAEDVSPARVPDEPTVA